MNGPPSIAGFLSAAMCTCGAATNDCMIFRCEFAIYIAAVAGAIRLDHAYHWLYSGSTTTFGFKNTLSVVKLMTSFFSALLPLCPFVAQSLDRIRIVAWINCRTTH